MHSGSWWEDHQQHNGLFCTYYVLGPGPGFQEVVKLVTVTVCLHFLSPNTVTVIISLNRWYNPKMQAVFISCIEK